jgi:hypothetical protein
MPHMRGLALLTGCLQMQPDCFEHLKFDLCCWQRLGFELLRAVMCSAMPLVPAESLIHHAFQHLSTRIGLPLLALAVIAVVCITMHAADSPGSLCGL